MYSAVMLDFVARCVQQWPEQLRRCVFGCLACALLRWCPFLPQHHFAHATQTSQTSAMQQMQQNCLGLVIGLVRNEHGPCYLLAGNTCQKRVANSPRSRLHVLPRGVGHSRHIGVFDCGWKIPGVGGVLHKLRFGSRLRAAQAMVQMCHMHQRATRGAQPPQEMQQTERVWPTRDCRNDTRVGA